MHLTFFFPLFYICQTSLQQKLIAWRNCYWGQLASYVPNMLAFESWVPYPKVSFGSLNNPQNSEKKILWKYEVDMLKIIIIIIGYILKNFTTHITIL
jgi:hypothetical protein